MQTYEQFERAIYRTTQKADESNMSYANRVSVAFHEAGEQMTLGQVKAFVLLRQSALSSEDKRKIISMTSGDLDAHKIDVAMRSLSSRILSDGSHPKKKVYPVNFVEEENKEVAEEAMLAAGAEDIMDEEEVFQMLLSEGDEQALLVQELRTRWWTWSKILQNWLWPSRLTRMLVPVSGIGSEVEASGQRREEARQSGRHHLHGAPRWQRARVASLPREWESELPWLNALRHHTAVSAVRKAIGSVNAPSERDKESTTRTSSSWTKWMRRTMPL